MTEQEAYDKGYKQGYADRIEMERALIVDDCVDFEYTINERDNTIEFRFSDGTTKKANIGNSSVKPTRAKGKWIEHEKVYECSECQIIRAKGTTGKYNFCPSCGADMRGEEE